MSVLKKILGYVPQSIKYAGVCCLLTTTLSSSNNAVKAEEITTKQLEEIAQQVEECYRVYAKEKGKSFIENVGDKGDIPNLIGWYKGLNPLSEENEKVMKEKFKRIMSELSDHFPDEYISFFVEGNLLEYHPSISIISLDEGNPLTPLEKRIKDNLQKGMNTYIETGSTPDGSKVYLVGKSMQPSPYCMICHERTPKGALVFILPEDKIEKLDFKLRGSGGGY